MENSSKTPTPVATAESKETKSKKVAVPGGPVAEGKNLEDKPKASADNANKEASNAPAQTPAPVATAESKETYTDEELIAVVIGRLTADPEFVQVLSDALKKHGVGFEYKKEAVSEEDIKSFPLLNEVGVVVGDSQDEVMGKAFVYIGSLKEKEGVQQQKSDVKRTAKITKDEVVAVKGGQERVFPRSAWNNLGKDKGGWKQKVNAPDEAKGGKS